MSDADLEVAAEYNVSTIRAVSPAGAVFEMRRPAVGWPSVGAMRTIRKRAEQEVEVAILQGINRGTLTSEQAAATFAHEVNKIVAARIGADYRWGLYE